MSANNRSLPEWITLAASCAIILLLLGLVSYRYVTNGHRPADIGVKIETQAIRAQSDGGYLLPVEITNLGDETALDVRVRFLLSAEGDSEEGELLISFLPGGKTEKGVVVFRKDPGRGDIKYVVSFLKI